jgi:hypothetical protein
MTKDVLLITETSHSLFARKVFNAMQEAESSGYKVEVKFSTAEGRFDVIRFSALLRVYAVEE